ncbi:MAG: MBL fold metallo-hydrolase [Acidimicrobiales bacterium]|nr:MBL fold metallo-hydrolase [Acidimicrobiales bacterium]
MSTSNIRVTILGASGSFAGVDQACTGYLVQSRRSNVLLDCGPGVMAQLQKYVSLSELDAIVITHCHPDHWVELPVITNALKYVLNSHHLPVYGTARTHDFFDLVATGPPAPTIVWSTIDSDSTLAIGDQRWSFALVDHPVETLAPRVEVGDSTFVFSSDTGPDIDPSIFGPDIDLLLCEASLPIQDEGQAPHISGREAGVIAREAGAARLVLTHFVPGTDPEEHRRDAELSYGAPVEIATMGAVFAI